MAVIGERVQVGATATRLDVVETVTVVNLSLANRGAASVFLGGAGVTAAAGYEFGAGEKLAIALRPGDGGLYAVTASGQVRVDRLQVGWS